MNIKKEIDWDDAMEYLKDVHAVMCDGLVARVTWADGAPTFTYTNTYGVYRHAAVKWDTVTLRSSSADNSLFLYINTIDTDNLKPGVSVVVPLRVVTYEPKDVIYDMETCATLTLKEGEELDPELVRRTLLTRVHDMDSAELQESITEYDEV